MKIFSIITLSLLTLCLNGASTPNDSIASVTVDSSYHDIDSNTVIFAWKLDDQYSLPLRAHIDTSLIGFQEFNPLLAFSSSNSTLSNIGSPSFSNDFFLRDQFGDLYFLNYHYPFFFTYNNTKFYNSRKPYTHVQYTDGGGRAIKEETVKLEHAQNISKRFGFGFRYNLLSSQGQFKFTRVKNNSFNAFTNYNGDNYMLHASFNINRFVGDLNGGIVDSIYQSGNYEYTSEIPTNFYGDINKNAAVASNTIRYFDFMLSHRYKLFSFRSAVDTNSSKFRKNTAEPMISHVFQMRRASKIYDDDSLGAGLYDHTFANNVATLDSISEFRLYNKLQLEFKTTFKKKVELGIFANLNHELKKYNYNTETIEGFSDSLLISSSGFPYYVIEGDSMLYINHNKQVSNLYIGGGFYGNLLGKLDSRFTAQLYLHGEKAGQTRIDGQVKSRVYIKSRPYALIVNGALENLVPGYALEHYFSNHFIWSENFDPVQRISLSGILEAPSNKIRLSGNYALIRNYIYYTDSMPSALNNEALNVIGVSLQKGFSFWKIHSENKFTYQVYDKENVLSIPNFIFYNSTYFDHRFTFKSTGGWLRTILGFTVRYESAFTAYSYMPATSMYHIQPDAGGKRIDAGNFPYVDLFFNLRLKRTRFFAKYENISSAWFDSQPYMAASYPSNQNMFKFGISWTFYD